MIQIEHLIRKAAAESIQHLFDFEASEQQLVINETSKNFEGDFTLVTFPLVKVAKGKPEMIGEKIGEFLQEKNDFIEKFNVVKGFLNLSLTQEKWLSILQNIDANKKYGHAETPSGDVIVLEYCGPNTNKPLHLGHIRNMMIGFSTAEILQANGHKVHKVNILNDRGIAICKSMLAWQKYGNGATPESTGEKGDHFVGKYYVEFSRRVKEQMIDLVADGMSEDEAKKAAPLQKEAQAMLLKWEAGDAEVRAVWEKMNGWVYEGFAKTYDTLGVDFEKEYAESEYYLSGKKIVQEGLESGDFYQKEDSSIWVDLEAQKLDQKLLLRSDGTSVYLTQDLGVAEARSEDFGMNRHIYVVADEQDYHFKVLKETLKKLGKNYAEGIYHLSYGMVDLPGGAKMKSREGTSVDADNLVADVVSKARESAIESGKIDDFDSEEAIDLFNKIGIGAIKFFILSVNPRKRMLFDPAKSVDLNGFTAPFIQYSFARIQAILNKYAQLHDTEAQLLEGYEINEHERNLAYLLYNYANVVAEAGKQYDPSLLAQHVYNLAKTFNKFYAENRILNNEKPETDSFRVALASLVARQIQDGLQLLGISTVNRM